MMARPTMRWILPRRNRSRILSPGPSRILQLLFVICQEHLELWYDAGAYPFPFARYTGAGISYGYISPKTIIRQDGAIFFLGTDKVFYRLQSTVPIRTSTHAVEHIIAQDADITKAYCFISRSKATRWSG